MFTRYFNTVGLNCCTPTAGFIGLWRTLCPRSISGWMGRPPWPHIATPSNYLPVSYRPSDIQHHAKWQQLLFSSYPGKSLHLSCVHMDRVDKEPPRKRMKSADSTLSPMGQSRPCRLSPPPIIDTVVGNLSCTNPPSLESTWTNSHKTVSLQAIKRQWEDFSYHYRHLFPSPQAVQDPPFDFSVMSYNILSQDLLQDNAYLYKHCHLPVLDWSHRLPNLLKELEQHNADILCLQEVQEDHYLKQIKPSLDLLGYHSEYKRRTGRKPDGCAVCFKRDRFSLVSCHPVEYFRPGVPLLDRDNVGLVLLLRPSAGPSSAPGLCVANTHLLYNPRRGDIKLAQLAVLLAEITRVSRPQGGTINEPCPIILCGDFNSVPWSPLYSFIRDSRLEYEGIPIGKVSGQERTPRGQRILTTPIWPTSLGINQRCQYETASSSTAAVEGEVSRLNARDGEEGDTRNLDVKCLPRIEHDLKLTSAYSHYLKDSAEPEITTCHSKTAITVDYIFYSAAQGDVSMQPECNTAPKHGLHLLGRLALMGETDLWTVNGLPNEHNSSDHLPLLAHFRLRC